MPEHPYADRHFPNIVEEVVRKPVEVATPQAGSIEMKKLRVLANFRESQQKLRMKIISERFGNIIILCQGLVEV